MWRKWVSKVCGGSGWVKWVGEVCPSWAPVGPQLGPVRNAAWVYRSHQQTMNESAMSNVLLLCILGSFGIEKPY